MDGEGFFNTDKDIGWYNRISAGLDYRHYALIFVVVLLFLIVSYLLVKSWLGPKKEVSILPLTKKDIYTDPIPPGERLVGTVDPEIIKRTQLDPHKPKPKRPKKEKEKRDIIVNRKKCSKGEAECRRVLEKIFGVPFPTVKPWWLINKSGHRLEFDCYNEKVGVSCEYNGRQHVEQSAFNQTDEQFASQQERDKLKLDLADKHGVYVITVPHTIDIKDIEEYIHYYLPWNRLKRLQEDMTE